MMLTQNSIELIRWIEHQKQIAVGLTTHDKKATTCYFELMIKVCLQHWFPLLEKDTPVDFPKPQPIQEKEKKVDVQQSRKPFHEVMTKEQFSECRLVCLANILLRLVWQSHLMKIRTEPSTPRD